MSSRTAVSAVFVALCSTPGAARRCIAEDGCHAHTSGTGLLQHRSDRKSLGEKPTVIEDLEFVRPEMCDQNIVEQTCHKLNGGVASETITKAVLQELLVAKQSDIDEAWEALGLDNQVVRCKDLCGAVVHYARATGELLPPSSDVACYSLHGKDFCNVDVSPVTFAEKLSHLQMEQPPDHGVQIVDDDEDESTGPSLVQTADGKLTLRPQSSAQSVGAVSAVEDRAYEVWEVVIRIANFFRIFPWHRSSESESKLAFVQDAQTSNASNSMSQTIAARNAQAQSWLTTIMGEMRSRSTTPFLKRWFGGSGSKSSSSVRSDILKTLSFVDRELVDGIRYIYPANRASPSYCDGGTIAYVTRTPGSPSKSPVCNSEAEAFSKRCAVDRSGRFFVYLCEIWGTMDEMGQISSMVHEAVHHWGPRDVKYGSIATQKLSQKDQLKNAANYQYFAQDVAQTAYGNPGTLPSLEAQQACGQTDSNCNYYKNQGYCSQAHIQKTCSYTCGTCGARAQPRPQPRPQARPPAPAQSSGCRDTDANCAYYKGLGYCANVENIRRQCKQTCGLCSAPRQSSSRQCRDTDPSCSHYTSYCDKDNVRAVCKKTCRVC